MRRVLLFSRAARSLAVGALGVALPLALEGEGLGTGRIAKVLSAGLFGAVCRGRGWLRIKLLCRRLPLGFGVGQARLLRCPLALPF